MKELRTMPLRLPGRDGILIVLLTGAVVLSPPVEAQGYDAQLFKRNAVRTELRAPQRQVRTFPDTVRILAIMVEFQVDADARTTGDGTFLLIPVNEPTIDPAPHDSTYFANKLLFLENYFRKSSDGKLIAKGEVLGTPVTLPKPMSAYAPEGLDTKPLADLVVESWQQADLVVPAISFSSYDAFVIFHAGVGRDIDLVSLLGFDPTPNDIPSLYVGLSTLRNFLNDPAFEGVSVQNGTFRITHSMILPETETRVIQSAGRSDTLLIGMNGMLASSFGSYLGLPDLFDTQRGYSAIGQFGLMDPAAIFSFNGMFPPEPSGWEKIFLGWVEPIVLNAGAQTVSIPAVGLTTDSDTVYKIPINEREYFLLENRNRDPLRNGQLVTLVQDGQIVTRHFARDTIGFATTSISALRGSLVDVEDFDWSLPGAIADNETIEGGGLLIWHIDEHVIEAKYALNEVNADPNRRGVALEEADGSLDIGQIYGLFDPGLGSEFGSPFDCWFEQNPSPAYRNLFDRSTFPNSNSNAGARTGISIADISPRSARMTATIRIGDEQIRKLAPFSRSIGADPVATHPTVTTTGVFVGNGSAVYAFHIDGSSKTEAPSGFLFPSGGQRPILVPETEGSIETLVGVQDSTVYYWIVSDGSGDGTYDSTMSWVVQLNQNISTVPTMFESPTGSFIAAGGERGTVWLLSNLGIEQEFPFSQQAITSITQLPTQVATENLLYAASGGELVNDRMASLALGSDAFPWILASGVAPAGNFVVAAQEGGPALVGVDRELNTRLFEVSVSLGSISDLAIGDVDQDGQKDIVVSAGELLHVFNRTGAALDGFPVQLLSETFAGTPLLGDIDGDGRIDILSLTSGGMVVAYDERGRIKDGFPFQSVSGAGNAALFPTQNNNVGLVVVSLEGEMQAWEFDASYNPALMQWPQHLHDERHTNSERSVLASPKPKTTEFFPKAFVYNWPNPVYGGTTQIRYFVAEDADVTVRIFDLVGWKITELNGRATGGVDNEITWDVSGIQSGVYLVHVEVNSGGTTESAVIKIAVIK